MIASQLFMNGLQLLLDSALKSLAVMLVAWVLVIALRKASAATRHWVWSAALVGLLALPLLSLVLPSWRIALLPSMANRNDAQEKFESRAGLPVFTVDTAKEAGEQLSSNASNRAIKPGLAPILTDSAESVSIRRLENSWPFPIPAMLKVYGMLKSFDWIGAALMFWAMGALLVIARLLAGISRIQQLAKSAQPMDQHSWVALAQGLATRLRLRGSVELRKSEQVPLPMTWGALRSVVMLPAEADAWPQECRSIVLLHELAHVKRRDCLTQTLAQVACALYWFNPLVWLAARQLHVERELACDDQVLQVGTKATEYASHLVEIARSFHADQQLSPVAVGMACSQLESRVRSILDPGVHRRGLNRLNASLITAGAICLVFCLAVVQPWGKTAAFSARTAIAAQATDESLALPGLAEQTNTVSQILNAQSGEMAGAGATSDESRVNKKQDDREAPSANGGSTENDDQEGSQTKAQSAELTANQIIEMKATGVTPEFVEAMRKQGFDNLTVRELVQLRVHGITDEYIKQARSWGGEKITVREITNLKISGVTAEYINAMKQSGYDGLTVRQLSELRIHGLTPEYVEAMRKLGYDKLTANQLTSLKIHGIDEAYIKEIQNWLGNKPSINQLLEMKIHGITPDFARQVKALGYDNVPINKLTAMKVHGIDEKFINEMRVLGFDKLTVDQLIQMKVHGIDADYIKKMRAAGLKNVSVNQMIEMKVTGIDDILLKEKVKEKVKDKR